MPPLLRKPMLSIAGAPAVLRYTPLPSKLQVLTEDSDGAAAIWDVSRGERVQHFPRARGAATSRYDELLAESSKEKRAVPSWFSISARSGSLELTLEPNLCFNTEVYASELGLASREADLRLNLGERLLRALFSAWRDAQPNAPAEQLQPALPFRPLSEVPVLVSEEASGIVLCRCSAAQLAEASAEAIPRWVAQSVLNGHFTPKETLKLAFYLAPSDALPELPPGANKLSAAKVLRVSKVAHYVVSKLPMPEGETPLSEDSLELLCNEKPLPADMSLATVRAFFWKNGNEDMAISYRRAPDRA
jgi:WD repeat-containing protein 48